METPKTRHFVCATIRLLCAWLSEETMALREDVYEILPFVFVLCQETFEAQKAAKLQELPGRKRPEFENGIEDKDGNHSQSSKLLKIKLRIISTNELYILFN